MLQWANQWPGNNWAIATGHPLPEGGYLAVLDIDPRNGGDETLGRLEKTHGPLPHSIRAISGGKGPHLYYRVNRQYPSRAIAEGIDLKCASGYVLVPPSKHKTGGQYVWDAGADPSETNLAAMPDWLVEELEKLDAPVNSPTSSTTVATDSSTDPRVTAIGAGVASAEIAAGTVSTLDAKNTMLGAAFDHAGYLGALLLEGKRVVCCPWAHEHSDERGKGKDSSTVIFPATAGNNLGGFKCLHAHCHHRGWRDVLSALPRESVAIAREQYRPRAVSRVSVATGVGANDTDVTEEWETMLDCTRADDGSIRTIRPSERNVALIISFHPQWRDVLGYDEFAGRVVALKELPTPQWVKSTETQRTDSLRESDYAHSPLVGRNLSYAC